MNPGSTLWIAGTSLSIEEGGYVTQLKQRVRELNIATRNISVGDQTSLMGFMRVLEHGDLIQSGDCVLWEYSLLDALLSRSAFFADDVHAARRQAWRFILERGAQLIVVLAAPRKYATRRSRCERYTVNDALELGLPCIDTRDLSAALGIHDIRQHYRDDRHLRHESSLIPALIDAIIGNLITPRFPSRETLAAWAHKNIPARWQWASAKQLAASHHLPTRMFQNSLVGVEALSLDPGSSVDIPAADRIVAIGIVSTQSSGLLWCGHPECRPASTRLPPHLPYEFLVRTTSFPCRFRASAIMSAAAYVAPGKIWFDYGQQHNCSSADVALFGILLERETTTRTKFRARLHYWQQHLLQRWRRSRAKKARQQ